MAVTNEECKCTDRDLRENFQAKHSDHDTQPRILQPVAEIEDLTVANGFIVADLHPGDMIFVAQGTDNTKPSLVIRNAASDGWYEFQLNSANTYVNDISD